MKRLITAITIAIIAILSLAAPTGAYDERVVKMNIVLEKYNSPMAGLEAELIKIAEDHDLDWTLMAAIAGTESSFGKRMPYQCINPYGWGIYGDNKLCFESFTDAALGVSTGLSTKYNTTSLTSIARTYNTVSTDSWLAHTQFFINKIKNTEIPVEKLPITL
jgi:hypothetical protein